MSLRPYLLAAALVVPPVAAQAAPAANQLPAAATSTTNTVDTSGNTSSPRPIEQYGLTSAFLGLPASPEPSPANGSPSATGGTFPTGAGIDCIQLAGVPANSITGTNEQPPQILRLYGDDIKTPSFAITNNVFVAGRLGSPKQVDPSGSQNAPVTPPGSGTQGSTGFNRMPGTPGSQYIGINENGKLRITFTDDPNNSQANLRAVEEYLNNLYRSITAQCPYLAPQKAEPTATEAAAPPESAKKRGGIAGVWDDGVKLVKRAAKPGHRTVFVAGVGNFRVDDVSPGKNGEKIQRLFSDDLASFVTPALSIFPGGAFPQKSLVVPTSQIRVIPGTQKRPAGRRPGAQPSSRPSP